MTPIELQLIEKGWEEYRLLNESRKSPEYLHKLNETMVLLANSNGYPADMHKVALRMALTSDSFPLLFADVLQRQMLADYKEVSPVWKNFFRMGTVPRIYPEIGGRRFAMYGGDQFLQRVGEKGEYLATPRSELQYLAYVYKRGHQFDISWEALINDSIGALRDTPKRFSRAASRTESRLATDAYAGDLGTHVEGDGGDLYEIGVNASTNLLSVANLQTAWSTMTAFTDQIGEPIENSPKFLVVGTGALFLEAQRILKSGELMYTESAGGALVGSPIANVIADQGIIPLLDRYLPIVDTTNTNAWYLFSDPKDIAALEFNHLEGHENPEIAMKASDKVSVGGGAMSPFSGDFATDNVLYRIRHVTGTTKLDWRGTYMGGAAQQ